MTDKATVEITSPVSGTIVALHGEVGVAVAVGSPFVEFGADLVGSIEGLIPEPAAVAGSPAVVTERLAANSGVVHASTRPKTSPAVRRRAQDAGIALKAINGSGPHGRIRQSDLEAYLLAQQHLQGAANPAAVIADQPEFREVKLAGLRRKIAEKMELSTRRIPHFSYVEEVDVTELENARALLNARYRLERPKLSLLPFFVQALCRILPDFPQINATYDENSGIVRYYTAADVGIATQTDSGLIVPVLRDAARLGLWELANEIARLAAAARNGSAKRRELSGSTITISSLGALGGLVTTPVINHPEVAIIGPNRIVERPMAHDGTIALRKMMNISSSFDHRVVDGHDAGRFIQSLRQALEIPTLLLAR